MIQSNIQFNPFNISNLNLTYPFDTLIFKYALAMFANSRAHISTFVVGVSKNMVKEYRTPMLIMEIDISRLMVPACPID